MMDLPHGLSLPFTTTTRLGALHVGDSLDALREFPDASVDLVVTSPPYDRQPKYGNGESYRTDWFESLRRECQRLGGVPLFALVDGLGWARATDALGPVIRDCDGRVFTRATMTDMFDVEPFPALARQAD